MATTTTAAAAAQPLAADRVPIGEIMTRGAITVRDDLGLEPLIDLFLEQGISRVPVVDERGRAIGFVSKTDVVIAQHERGDTEVSQAGAGALAGDDGRHVHEVGGLVRDIMTPIALTLPASMSVAEAARRMLADNVHAVPVTSETGQVVGWLSSTDIVAWVAGVQLGHAVAASPAT